MKFLKPSLVNVLRDKTANNIVVAVLIGFSLSEIINIISISSYGPVSQWWSMAWRQLVAVVAILILAELTSRLAKR